MSTWEIATKEAAGRLRLPTSAAEWLADPRHRRDVTELPITFDHAVPGAGTLPPHHRDPFDRMLVAQAQLEGLVLVSADPKLAAYDVEASAGPGEGLPRTSSSSPSPGPTWENGRGDRLAEP